VTGPDPVFCTVLESVAPTVNVLVSNVVGVPVIVQLFAVSVRPAGNTPAVIVQAYGAVPPVTPIVPVYGTPIVAPGSVATTCNVLFGVIVMLNGPFTLCFGLELSVTPIVRVELSAVVGVPLTVQPVSVRPAGSTPARTLQLYGVVPPLTPISWL
jgi:hypothetical protein